MTIMERLIAFTLRRRVTVLMMAASALLVGVVSYTGLPLELLPSGLQEPEVTIHIPVPSSTPMEVLEQVVRPTEEAVRTIPGIKNLTSRAGATRARVSVEFGRDVDLDLATAELRDRLERARLQWPDQVEDYFIWRFNADTDIPVFSFAIDLERYSDEVTFLVEEKVIKPIEALPGVARVRCWGLLDDQIRVSVDRQAALAQRISIYELVQELRRANVQVTGGRIEEGGVRYTVRTDARLRGVEELRRLPLNAGGLRLEQIADVRPVKAVKEFMALSRNKRSLWCMVYKESSANTVATAARVRSMVTGPISEDSRLRELGGRPRLYERSDFGLMITGALDTLRRTATTGAVLALLVLFFFLRRLRLTLVITLSIPLTLLITLGGLYFGGSSLNVLSMLGITVSIGMLIDNSIVVAESIARHRELGAAPLEAARRGASEVALAITLSTMTTVAAFLPLIFMTGEDQLGFFTRGIGSALCLAVVLSLLVALLFIPLATVLVRSRETRRPGLLGRSALLEGARRLYVRSLRWTLAHRLQTFLVAGGLVAGLTAAAWDRVSLTDVRSESGGRLRIGVELDRNFTLADAHEAMTTIGRWLDRHAEEHAIRHFWCFFRENGGGFRVDLDHQDMSRTRATAERLDAELPRLAGVHYSLGVEDRAPEEHQLRLAIYGPDPRVLLRLSREIAGLLENVPGVLSVTSNQEEGPEELHIVPDRDRAALYGVDPRALRGTVEAGIRGHRFSDLVSEDQEIPLIAQHKGADTATYVQVRDMPIPTQEAGRVPLAHVAATRFTRGPGEIHRRNGRIQATLTIEADPERHAEVARRLRMLLADHPLPRGYSFKENKAEQLDRAGDELRGSVLLSATFVFLLMGVLFESFVLPFAVMVTIPFSWAGALWLLALTGRPLDFVGAIGVFVLVGVVVNNGIVLVDCARRHLHALGSRGAAEGDVALRPEALARAAHDRFRPILMTAATTVVGLLPMAVADSGGSQISYRALAQVVIGGLAVATAFTLYFVPLLFTLADDVRRATAGLLGETVLAARGQASPRTSTQPLQSGAGFSRQRA